MLLEFKKELWGGEFWSESYDAGMVGTGGSWAAIEAYVKNKVIMVKDL